MKNRKNDKGRSALFIPAVFIVMIVLMACGVKDTTSRSKEEKSDTGFREIHIVGAVTPEPIEYVDFDLDKLAITGKEAKDDGRKTSEYQSEDLGDTGTDASMPEGIGEYDTDDGAGSESDDTSAVVGEEVSDGYEPFPDGDPKADNGYADSEGGESLPELLESGDDGSRLQGSVENEYEYEQPIEESDEHNDSGVDEQGQSGSGEPDDSGNGDTNLTYLGTYTATAYCACPICTGAYSTGYTASGTFATEGRTVACNTLPFGTQIYIEGYGYYTVEDTGWSPYGDAWLDLFYSSHDSALAFGVRNVEVYLVN